VEELVEYIELNKRDCKKKRDEALEGGDRWKRFNAKLEALNDIQCFLGSGQSAFTKSADGF
jgi:hypothetical protein